MEKAVIEQRSKASMEVDLRHAAQNAGSVHYIPRTEKQCFRLMSYLQGEIDFYIACCKPYGATAETCEVCKESLWTNGLRRRPRHIFFVRKVQPWLDRLLSVKAIASAVDHMRKQTHVNDVWADVFDGEYIQELIQKSISSVHRHHSHDHRSVPPDV